MEAIKLIVHFSRDDITYNGFPHNAQMEFFEPSHLEYGVDMVHELDRQFGKRFKSTISQRDVPGMTRAAIPLLAKKGKLYVFILRWC